MTTTKPIPSAIEALRKAETALAVACSFRVVTDRHGATLNAALEGARDVLTAHDTGKAAPGRDALADFGLAVLRILEDDEDWSSETLDGLAAEAHRRELAIADGGGEFRVRPGLPDSIQAMPTLNARELAIQQLEVRS